MRLAAAVLDSTVLGGGQHYGKKKTRMKLGEQEEGLMTEWLRESPHWGPNI